VENFPFDFAAGRIRRDRARRLRDSFAVLSDFKGLQGEIFPFDFAAGRRATPRFFRGFGRFQGVARRKISLRHLSVPDPARSSGASARRGEAAPPPRRLGQRYIVIAVEFAHQLDPSPGDCPPPSSFARRSPLRSAARSAVERSCRTGRSRGSRAPVRSSAHAWRQQLLHPRNMRDREPDRQPFQDPKSPIHALAARRERQLGRRLFRAAGSWKPRPRLRSGCLEGR
jgi:hypothetical protein